MAMKTHKETAATSPLKLLLVDDHHAALAGLCHYFQQHPDFSVVGTATDGVQALEMLETALPHVILMDLSMPRLDGIRATQAIRRRWPRVKVLAFTARTDRNAVARAMHAGASGFVIKDASMEELAHGYIPAPCPKQRFSVL